jgi:hypothetical protein
VLDRRSPPMTTLIARRGTVRSLLGGRAPLGPRACARATRDIRLVKPARRSVMIPGAGSRVVDVWSHRSCNRGYTPHTLRVGEQTPVTLLLVDMVAREPRPGSQPSRPTSSRTPAGMPRAWGGSRSNGTKNVDPFLAMVF